MVSKGEQGYDGEDQAAGQAARPGTNGSAGLQMQGGDGAASGQDDRGMPGLLGAGRLDDMPAGREGSAALARDDMPDGGMGSGNGSTGYGFGGGGGDGAGGGDGGDGGRQGPGGSQASRCATMTVHHRLMATDPEYARNRAVIERHARLYETGELHNERTGVTRIPVVVHVVWNRPEQNISDAQIRSQIDVLNRDFRRTNPDVSTTPAPFQPLVADARIEFFLATTNPSGEPSTGIQRRQTTVSAFPDDDSVKFAARGGLDAWPAEQYLNIWVCPLARYLGYAQFPGGPAATDGVVILHRAFGTTGTAAAPYNLGRTATHEIGHWLNLRHIWGDDDDACTGTDHVADTPNQGGPNYGAPAFPHVSCSNGPNGDLFMNYMDYVDDRVMVMFSNGQVERMQTCLDGARSTIGLAASTGSIRPRSSPVVAWSPNRIDVFTVGTNRAVYHKWWSGTWGPSATGFEHMGGTVTCVPQAVSWQSNRIDLFVTGTDSALYHKWWDGVAWRPSLTGYESMGGACLGDPCIVSSAPNRLDVFVVGTNRALYHKRYAGGWTPSLTTYANLGGTCMEAPEVVTRSADLIDVFVVGPNRTLYHKRWNGSAWLPSTTGYNSLGGRCRSAPHVVASDPNRIDVFMIGFDGALYHKWWDGSAWRPSLTGFESLGGLYVGEPEVVARAPNRLDVFGVGIDGAVYRKSWDGAAWSPATGTGASLGGLCTSQPRVVAAHPNRLDLFITGVDSALLHKWWAGAAWSPSALGYDNLGGVFLPLREPAPEAAEATAAPLQEVRYIRQPTMVNT